MDRLGFIREKLDIKILILFILGRLEDPIDRDTLTELTLFDEAISYFDFLECVTELIDTEHIRVIDGGYTITNKGRRNGKTTENRLPYSVRCCAEQITTVLAQSQRRDALVKSDVRPCKNGGFTVSLTLSDGLGDIFKLELYAANEAQVNMFVDSFYRRAEQVYAKLIESLTHEK